MSRKIAQTIPGNSGGANNRVALRQKQVLESQNAKFKQLVHMTNEKSSKVKDRTDEKGAKSAAKQVLSGKQATLSESPKPF